MEKKLGKICKATFGIGGYQGSMLGLHLVFSGTDGWGVGSTKSTWDSTLIKHSKHCKWTEEHRSKDYADIMRHLSTTLNEAKVTDVSSLVGIPVEVTFEGNTLKEWRVLTEVI